MKKTILVTGSSGFIGKNITEQLNKKYIILVPSHKMLNLLNTLSVENYFKHRSIDTVVHCAAVGVARNGKFADTSFKKNLQMFFNLVRCQRYFSKFINLGSGAEYDKSRPLIRVNETDFDKRIPSDNYGLYKYICSKYTENSKKIICLRIFGLFGKHENYRSRFISYAILRNIKGLPIIINQNVYFDYIYIYDFIKIIDYFITHQASQKFYNIGRGKKVDLVTLAEKINLIGIKPSKIVVKKPGFNNEYTCDNSRLLKELNRFKFTGFNQSITELYNWYKNL